MEWVYKPLVFKRGKKQTMNFTDPKCQLTMIQNVWNKLHQESPLVKVHITMNWQKFRVAREKIKDFFLVLYNSGTSKNTTRISLVTFATLEAIGMIQRCFSKSLVGIRLGVAHTPSCSSNALKSACCAHFCSIVAHSAQKAVFTH